MLSIIMPAHNEANGIIKTLDYLLEDNVLSDVELFIVCNGCTDDTASVVRAYASDNEERLTARSIAVQVNEVTQASKIVALNTGLELIDTYPVVLLDADIHIQGESIYKLAKFLHEEELLAAAPQVKFDWSMSNRLAESYYRVSSTSSYNAEHRLSNVIALSRLGVERLGQLPNVIADDEYIRRKFKQYEYGINSAIEFVFTCPKDLRNLLNVLTRVERGNFQLELLNYHDHTEAKLSGPANREPFSYLIFLVCKALAKFRAKWQLKKGLVSQWERDESNR